MQHFRDRFLMHRFLCTGLILMAAFAASVSAAEKNPPDEERFRQLASELRCLVCQNQSIADSSASLAVDLRGQIQEQMLAGKSDDEIRAYMVARYGDFILYSPPLKATTLMLWAGPFLLLAFAAGLGVFVLRRRAGLSATVAEDDSARAGSAEALWQKENRK